jgi:hypothetical protein
MFVRALNHSSQACMHKAEAGSGDKENKTEIAFSPYPRESKTFIYIQNRQVIFGFIFAVSTAFCC